MDKSLSILFFVACTFVCISCQTYDEHVRNTIVKKYKNKEQEKDLQFHSQVTQAYERLKAIDLKKLLGAVKATKPSACYNDVSLVIGQLMSKQIQTEVLYLLDSFGKPPPAILFGLFNWLGNYDECTNVTVNLNTTKFTGRYCNMKVGSQAPTPPGGLPQSVTIGACIPSSCGIAEAEYYINLALSLANVTSAIRTFGGSCQPLESEIPPLNAGAIVMIIIFTVLGIWLVVGTLYDICIYQRQETNQQAMKSAEQTSEPSNVVYSTGNTHSNVVDLNADVNVTDYTPIMDNYSGEELRQSKKEIAEDTPLLAKKPDSKIKTENGKVEICRSVLLAFSVPRNLSKLFSVPPPSDSNLAVIHGIRFVSMSWVVLGHTFFFAVNYIANPIVGQTLINRWTFQAILNATVSVDTFFLLSGALSAYLLFREMDKNGSWNLGLGWLMLYVHRYWRLTAPYMLLVGFWTTLYQYTGSGANWPIDNTAQGTCNKTWWTNLLYVNNFIDFNRQCFGWSWYLANDMQFFIISPFLFIVPLYVSKLLPLGLITVSLSMLACWISGGVLSATHEDGIGITLLDAGYFDRIYIKPYTRIGPYLVGIMLGWVLWKTKLQYRMHWLLATLGWMVSAACALAIIYGPYSQIQGHIASVGAAALYNSVSRTVWGGCVAWVIFACLNGYGGYVNSFLTWPALVPLSRLTYMAYLIHPMVLLNYNMTRSTLIYIDDFQIVYLFIGNLVVSYMVALVASLALESPLMGIERALRRKDK